ncbi:MAG: M4 family metallopeptidase, partial [Chloroflexota bacterium]
SMSDVFGIQIKQFALNQDVTQSDWLIGADIVGPALEPALRSLKAPGTANPHDSQPSTMDGYVQGGDVHTNSGIPNHAFYVVATMLGGHAWDAAGQVWYATLTDPSLAAGSTFEDFAKLTLVHAQRTYGPGSDEALATLAGWEAVKVVCS